MSPTPTDRRLFVAFRIAAAGLTVIDGLAVKHTTTRSQVIRSLLRHALATLPKGWKP